MAILGSSAKTVCNPLGLGAIIWTDSEERLVMNVSIAAALNIRFRLTTIRPLVANVILSTKRESSSMVCFLVVQQ